MKCGSVGLQIKTVFLHLVGSAVGASLIAFRLARGFSRLCIEELGVLREQWRTGFFFFFFFFS